MDPVREALLFCRVFPVEMLVFCHLPKVVDFGSLLRSPGGDF